MKKTLGVLTFLLFGALGTKAQSVQDSIPQVVKDEVAGYLEHISYCNNTKIKKVDEKTEDRDGDGLKDKVILYSVEGCDVIPNYIILTKKALKNGGFLEPGKPEAKNYRDKDWNSVKPEDW